MKYLALAALSACIGLSAQQAFAKKGGVSFKELDVNKDKVISREEWRGNDSSFYVHDRDDDGVISKNESRQLSQGDVEDFLFGRGEGHNANFGHLDRNDDDHITLREWDGTPADFEKHDLNRDGILSRREFYYGQGGKATS